ncbi:hypothetical protein PFISCL1PPCAC_10333, partial [Pristionchus fissidentatus]
PLFFFLFLSFLLSIIINLCMDESIEAQLQLAGSLYSNGQYEEALETYRQTANKWPENGIVRSNLSALLLKVSKVEEATEEAKKAVQLSPQWYKTHFRLGECYRSANRYVEALLSYSRGLRIDSSNGQLIDASLQCAITQFRDRFPLATLRRSELASNAVSVLVCIGQSLFQEGLLIESREILLNAYSIPSPSVTVHFSLLSSLSSISSLLEDHESALKYAKEQYELCSNHDLPVLSSLESISRESESIGDLEASIAARLQIIDRCDDDVSRVSHLLHIGHLYLSIDSIEESSRSFTSVLLLDCSESHRLSARAGLAFTVYHRGETREAIQLMEDLESTPLDEKLRLRLLEFKSLAMMKEGTFDSNSLSKIIDESTNPSTVAKLSHLLAQHFLSTGKTESALKMVKKSLANAKRMKEIPLEASSLILLSQIYELHSDQESALSLLNHCVELPRIPFKQKTQALHSISSLLESLNRLDEAVERLREAEKICDERNDVNGVMKIRSIIKSIMKKKGELDPIESKVDQERDKSDILQEQLAEAQELNNEVDEASLCISLGEIYEKSDKLEEALHYYQQALTVAKELRVVRLIGLGYLGVSRVLSLRGEWSRVESCARAAITMARLTADGKGEEEAIEFIALSQINKGEIELGRKVYLKMLRRLKMREEKEKSAEIHFRVARISEDQEAESHFWSCLSSTSQIPLKIDSLLHLSSLPSTSNDPHCLLKAALAYAIQDGKLESLLRLSNHERELEWIEDAIETSLYAVIKHSDNQSDDLIDDLLSYHPRQSLSLLLSMHSKRKDSRILYRLFRILPEFVLQELENEEGDKIELLRSLCKLIIGEEMGSIPDLDESESLDLLGFNLSSYVNQHNQSRKTVEETPNLMISTIESNRIDLLIGQYDSLLLELTRWESLLPSFAIDSFSFCTIVVSLFIPSTQNLLHILELASWILAGHGGTPPSSSTVPASPFIRLFSCKGITIVWSCTDGDTPSPSYLLSSPQISPLEDSLLSLLESQSIPHSSTLSLPPEAILIGIPPTELSVSLLPSSHLFSLSPPSSLPLLPPSSSLLIIDILNITPSTSSVTVNPDQFYCSVLLSRKILSSDICLVSSSSLISRLPSPLLLSTPNIGRDTNYDSSPSLFILSSFSSLPSSFLHSLISALFSKGTKTVLLLSESTTSTETESLMNEPGRFYWEIVYILLDPRSQSL